MVAMLSRMCSLLRQDGHQQWGFWLQGGKDQGRPITINKVGMNSIADVRGLRFGDTVLQIGRERTIDMTHTDAQRAVQRQGNRLEMLILRPANQEETPVSPNKDDRTSVRAIVYKQSNSPIGLYSPENVAETFIEQTKVLTRGAVRLSRNPQSLVQQNFRNMQQKSDVYRMVHEEDSSGKFVTSPEPTFRPYMYSRSPSGSSSPTVQSQSFNKLRQSLYDDAEEYTSSSSNSPTPTFRKQQTAPQPPPKPVAARPEPQYHQQQQHDRSGHYQANHQPQVQPQQRQPPPYYQQGPPPPQQQPPQQQHHQQQQQHHQQQQHQQQQHQQQHQQQQHQQQQHFYQQQQQQIYRREEDFSDRPKYQPYPQVSSQPKQPVQVTKQSSTFQTNIPFVQNSSPTPHQDHQDGVVVNQIQWSPTTGRRRPVWPPPKQEPPISTSSQSMKFAGGRPSKQFIWPPPKDFVEVTEDVQGNQRSVIYRHVPEDQANKARVYVSPRAPARLAAAAWEPYSPNNEAQAWLRSSCPSKRLRRFDDIFSSNSTPLPPTYRAPPGTFHVSA